MNHDDLKRDALKREDLPTPALMLDIDAFESNVAKMATHAREHNRALLPHGKTHKCPEVAKALIRAGAVGACGENVQGVWNIAARGTSQ